MPLDPDPQLIRLQYDPAKVPDWKAAQGHVSCLPANCVVEMFASPDTLNGIAIPSRLKQTYYDEHLPVAGFEPNIGVVLAVGFGYHSPEDEFEPGDVVVLRDGDGIEIEGFEAGEYKATGVVRILGKVIPDATEPQWVKDLPLEESMICVVGRVA